MKTEVLYFDGCPNHERLVPRLRRLLQRAKVADTIDLVRVESAEVAVQHRFLGSPTLRIDGVDVDPGARDRSDYGLKCRLYRTERGYEPLPPDEWVLAAVAPAAADREAADG